MPVPLRRNILNTAWEERQGELRSPPLCKFDEWWRGARELGAVQPEAAALATAAPDGRPSVRMVLVRGYGEDGILFFSHADSRKGEEMRANPQASLCLHWPLLERQVRVEGQVCEAPAQVADRYFASRPLGSRVSAAVSPQSQEIADYEDLARQQRDWLQRVQDGEAPPKRPQRWWGWCLQPASYEFWQGMPDRLHRRELWVRQGGDWTKTCLAP